ncbi:MAG: hypothetical protein LBR68_02555 [Lachnoclostridium sp.]|jgi:NADH/NAD ratio-sensing transcriptional regulator Rex|nr:hypothetical protein [Lachnoclostridium sp.]
MAIAQDAFFIPDDIATGLATGLYRRIGSVVRHAAGPNKGQIVKHLQPVDNKAAEKVQGMVVKAFQFVKQHKKGTIIVVVGTATIGTGIWAYNKVKNRELKVVTDFRAALRVYIDAVRKGSMDIDKINNLMGFLEKLKTHKDYEKISIQLTTEELELLVGRIYDYTIKLANDNKVEFTEDELHIADAESTDTIVSLQTYLQAQKRIFEAVA